MTIPRNRSSIYLYSVNSPATSGRKSVYLSIVIYVMSCILNWPLPTGAFNFRANETNHWNNLDELRIPTGMRQTSWLCNASATEELNQELSETNPAGLKIEVTRSQVWCLNHSAELPVISYMVSLSLGPVALVASKSN